MTHAYPPIARLLGIMARLRDPERGCPWDREQDFGTIAPYTIEEAYEVGDAIERGDMAALKDELGDLLFQVVFHARMAEEAGYFAFDEVAAAIADKMVRRHPHVFGDAEIASVAAQNEAWEAHKAEERAARGGGDRAKLEDEVGDLLFAAANLARKLEIEPETALRRATAKFERRFRAVETLAKERDVGRDLDVLEALWRQVKAQE